MLAKEALAIIEPAATRVRDPQTGRSIWMAKIIKEAILDGEALSVGLLFSKEHTPEEKTRVTQALTNQIRKIGWNGTIDIQSLSSPPPQPDPKKSDPVTGMSGPGMGPHGGPIKKMPLPGIKRIIAVASGKGGVGKSTVATNLAIALKRHDLSVGLMDADVYGPSLPTMMRVSGQPIANDQRQIIPKEAYGIPCISMGFMIDDKEPVIWRGPMVMGVIKQFFQNVAWGELDVLVVDLPPGTGDAQLTMIQAVPIDGAVIVTTPQKIATIDAVRGVEMFRKLDVPILGIVENMSYIQVNEDQRLYPFGSGGGKSTAEQYSVPLLAQIPLEEGIRLGGDLGVPAALSTDPISEPFLSIGKQVQEILFT
ncbi:MAG: Mrp/NBP35 family ATP-binding protein [Myxococcota bacterium]|nr:Mrp/NBP35 family ATP-binding protein [Myxococcota bacterium]